MEAIYNQHNNELDKDFPTEHFIPLTMLEDFLNERKEEQSRNETVEVDRFGSDGSTITVKKSNGVITGISIMFSGTPPQGWMDDEFEDSFEEVTNGLSYIGIPEEFFSIFDPKRFGEVDKDFPLEHCFNKFQIENLIMMEINVSAGATVSEAFSYNRFKI